MEDAQKTWDPDGAHLIVSRVIIQQKNILEQLDALLLSIASSTATSSNLSGDFEEPLRIDSSSNSSRDFDGPSCVFTCPEERICVDDSVPDYLICSDDLVQDDYQHVELTSQLSSKESTTVASMSVSCDETGEFHEVGDTGQRIERAKSQFHSLSDLESYEWHNSFVYRLMCKCNSFFDSFKEPPRTGFLADIVLSDAFEIVVSIIILFYIIFSTLATDWLLQHAEGSAQLPPDLQILENIFEGAYLLEILLRLSVHRVFYFLNEDRWWNRFDVIWVSLGILNQFISSSNGMFLRFLRTAKMARKIMRMLRLANHVSDLRIIAQAFVGSLMSLMWCILVLAVFSFGYGLFFCSQFALLLAEGGNSLSPYKRQAILDNFGSVGMAVLTLLKSISGGIDWGEVYSIVGNIGNFSAMVFLSYVFTVWLSLCNIITSIFLDKAMNIARPEANAKALEHFKDRLANAQELARLFHMIAGESEIVTPDRLRTCLQDVRIGSHMATHGIDLTDVDTFLELLTENQGTAEIHINTFVTGCLSLRGNARSIDLLTIKHKLQCLEELLQRLVKPQVQNNMKQDHQSRGHCILQVPDYATNL